MRRPRIIHLVDDSTAGGVMRVLEFITGSSELAQTAQHVLCRVDRRSLWLGRLKADVIVSHLTISWRGLPSLTALRASHPRTPLIHVEHSYTETFVARNVKHKQRFATLLKTTYALFDRVVAVSHAQGNWLLSRGYVRAQALTVIQSCVDLSAFREIAPVKGPVRIIGAIGRLERVKGYDTLIHAMRHAATLDVELHIYGVGSEEAELRQLAQADPRIHFKGFTEDPVAAMAAVDAVAIPSRWETYGLVAVEAFSAGRPVLANKVDGLSDHAARGAVLVEDQSAMAWAHALTTLRQTSPVKTPAVDDTPETLFINGWKALLQGLEIAPKPAK